MTADSYFSCPSIYKSRWRCEKQQGCVRMPLREGIPSILAFSYLSHPGAREGRKGREKTKQELCRHGSRAGERAGKYSPAQVAIHGFHIIVLAAGKCAQLVEGHSWRGRKVTQSVAIILTESCKTQPTLSIRELMGRTVGLQATLVSQVISSLILLLQDVIYSRLTSYQSKPTWTTRDFSTDSCHSFSSSCASSNAD